MYSYAEEKPWLFTDAGQRCVLAAYKRAVRLLEAAGAVNGMKVVEECDIGNTFKMLAVLDRLVELGELREITGSGCWGQDRVFVAGRRA